MIIYVFPMFICCYVSSVQLPCVYIMYLTGLFLCRPINVNTSQGITADLPQLSVDDSWRPLMSEGLSKANHNTGRPVYKLIAINSPRFDVGQ